MLRLTVLVSIFISQIAWATPAPQLTVINRVQTPAAYQGIYKLVRDKGGAPLYVLAEQMADHSIQLEVRDHNNTIVQAMPIAPATAGGTLRLLRTDVTANGDIVLALWDGNVNGAGVKLISDNITQKRSTVLATAAMFPQLNDRIIVNGRNLVLVSIDGPTSNDPSTVKVIDEDTGAVISQVTVSNPVSGRLGLDKMGNLKALMTGYELFGLIDVKSSTYTDLIPPRQQPSQYPGDLELVTGKFITLSDGKTQQLLKLDDLINGQIKPVITLPATAQILQNGQYIAVSDSQSTTITDVKTMKAIAKIAKGKPAGVDDLIMTKNGLIVAMGQAADPMSYMPGSILTYINAKSGQVLRTMTDRRRQYQTQLAQTQYGDVVAIESDRLVGRAQYNIVDVTDDSLISSGNEAILGGPVLSGSGELVAVKAQENQPICVFNVLDESAQSCVTDSQVNSLVLYGYEPLAVRPGLLELPLMGPVSNLSAPVIGYIDLHID
jgi:hypothetical protein